ncbi:MAG: hypothetical protein K2W95_04440 [Candidatus Obscuribacterales bacterium]|nr:hypothetical protein [Candidatus Obscuribacterales bacterium]
MLTREELLPNRIPENLTAAQYYELGLRFRLAGHTALAKGALQRVLSSAENSPYGRKAAVVLRSQLPVNNVPESAEEKNISAYNLMQSDPAEAKRLFEELMNQHPDFEWPFSNYAWMMVNEGNLNKAHSLSRYLLALNPDHLRSIHLAMQIALMQDRKNDALELAKRGLKASGGDPDFAGLVQGLLSHIKGKPPDSIPQLSSAEEYFDLGCWFDAYGKIRLAQEALDKAIECDCDCEIADRVRKHKQSYLPVNPVPAAAEQMLQEAFAEPDTALSAQTLRQLLHDYPDFETPVIALATLALQASQFEQCEQYARKALSINARSEPALIILLKLYLMQDRFEQALKLLDTEFPAHADRSLTMDLIKAQCELGLYDKSRVTRH